MINGKLANYFLLLKALKFDFFNNYNNNLLKVMQILEMLSCDTEISESIKDEFTIYIQKVRSFLSIYNNIL